MKRVFFDTEFTDLTQNCDLISIGLVCVDDDSAERCGFYGVFTDFDRTKCSEFVRRNVIPNLTRGVDRFHPGVTLWEGTRREIRNKLLLWFESCAKVDVGSTTPQVQMWSDCLAYDWVLLRTLFNDNLPDFIYYIPFDLCTLLLLSDIDPDISREEFANIIDSKHDMKHNSYYDAEVIEACYNKLIRTKEGQS